MRHYPDILDDAGKTPREFGSHHVHVEPIAVEDGFAWAVVWFQAAFQPADERATFEIRAPLTGEVLLSAQRVPDVGGGVVSRGLVRFAVTDAVTEVTVHVESRVDEDAQRCRQPWKLLDTIEVPRSEPGLWREYYDPPPGQPMPPYAEIRRLPPRPLTDSLLVSFDRSRSPPGLLEQFAVVWRPGEPPLPPERAPPPVPPKRVEPMTGYRECVKCEFSGAWKDFGEDEQCPRCGYWW